MAAVFRALPRFPDHEHLWADANGELIFTFGSPYFLKTRGRKRQLPSVFVIGPFTRSFDLYSTGVTGLVGVRLFPWGFFTLSRLIVADLVDAVMPATKVFGADITDFASRLCAHTHEDRVAHVRDWLRAKAGSETTRKMTVRPVALRIMEGHGTLSVTDLAHDFGIVRRRLERSFRAQTGLSPKQYSRIVRFNHAKQLIQRNPCIALTELTYAAGFSDQAHFSKDFKEMFGITPATFKAQMAEALALLAQTPSSVAFLQDE